MRIATTLLLSTLCLAPVLGSAARASADTSVIVLGLRSVEGDDEVANAMTDALRDAAHQVPGWQLLDRSVSMAQMSLAHGCDEIDASCLADIAKGLSVDRVIYGTIRRTSAHDNYDYQVALSIFDAGAGTIGSTETDSVPRGMAQNGDALRARAISLVLRLAGGGSGAGTLTIRADVASAEVRLDGQMAGQTRNRVLVLEGVAPGEHTLEVSAVGHETYARRIEVSASAATEVNASLDGGGDDDDEDDDDASDEPSSRSVDQDYGEQHKKSSLKWLGYTLLGVSGASVIGVGVSWLVLNGINGDATFKKYSNAVDPSLDDICAEAEKGNRYSVTEAELKDVDGMCGTGATFEVLQYVFLGTALVSGGIGTYLLVTDRERTGGRAATSTPALALHPSVGKRSAMLTARVSF